MSKAEIKRVVSEEISKVKAALLEERYHYPLLSLLGNVRQIIKFADPKEVKEEFDAQILALLGERTEADKEKPKKVRQKDQNYGFADRLFFFRKRRSLRSTNRMRQNQ